MILITHLFTQFYNQKISAWLILINLNTLTDAAALSNVEQPGYNIPTPGAPGLINIDHVHDNAGSKQGDIGHFGVTDDLTPTLQGTIEGGEDQVQCRRRAGAGI
ncbi:hypothetical protein MUA03_20950 [Enterobacteriaceae bacterium H16N7]|nr:hypothetical protein [Dryocola clanedunensis]